MRRQLPLLLTLVIGCNDAPILVGQTQSIVNGQQDPGHPAVGLLHIKFPGGQGAYCTGTLVGPHTVLTAAHCVVYEKQAPFTEASSVSFYINGQASGGTISGAKHDVISFVYHPSYGSGASGPPKADVAVLRLAAPVVGVKPIRLESQGTYKGENVTLVGYGRTGKDNKDSGTKRTAQNTVEEMLAAHFTYKGAFAGEGCTCSGDSGGPVLANRGGEEVQIGIHSAGTCAISDDPSTITGYSGRSDMHYAWIEGAAQGDLYKGGPLDTSPPQVSITNPTQQATVHPSFAIHANVIDDGTIKAVRFFVNGQQVGQQNVAPFQVKVPTQPEGPHQIRVEAEDSAGHSSSATATVTVVKPKLFGAPCSHNVECNGGHCVTGMSKSYCSRGCNTPADCPQAFDCVNAVCIEAKKPPPAPGPGPGGASFGQSCGNHGDCQSGLCAQDLVDGSRFCTMTCSVENNTCPGGATCHPTGDTAICGSLHNDMTPGNELIGGACDMTAGGRSAGAPALLLLLLLPLVLRRHRR